VSWPYLCRQLGLAVVDRQAADGGQRKVQHPKTRIRPDAHGLTVHLATVPGVGRKQLEDVADHLADHWGAQRVAIAQPSPGRLVVRAMRRDPLLEPFSTAQAPSGVYGSTSVPDLSRLYVGRDEHGQHRWMQVRDNTTATVAGQPGSGKSNGINGLLLQWAPSPAVQFGTADGKSPVDGGDYEVWRPRAWRTCSDSREDTADMLSDACKVMRERLGCVAELTGSRNAWHRGPTVDFPLFGLVLDEAQRYLDAAAAIKAKDTDLVRLITQMQAMAGDIARQGRAALMFLVLATQRATVDSIPGQIREAAALSLALSTKTADAAAAALGSEIRNYPSFSPTTLQGPEFTGCAIASMRTGQDPFTRLRMPEVTHGELQVTAAATAHLRRNPAMLMPVPAPDDVSALVP
jgi:S-DNA-T family DNA segregation ATPase FtsK/SpoIIIE